MDDSISLETACDEKYDNGPSLETPSGISLERECVSDPNAQKDNMIDTLKPSIDGSVVGMDDSQHLNDTERNDDGNDEDLNEEENGEENETQFLNAIQKLAMQLQGAAQAIEEEKESIMKELESYKEMRDAFEDMSRELIRNAKHPPAMSRKFRVRFYKQAECLRHIMANMPASARSMVDIEVISPMSYWFYQKCLQDAEKLCDVELERVRKCVSVSSIMPQKPSPGVPESGSARDQNSFSPTPRAAIMSGCAGEGDEIVTHKQINQPKRHLVITEGEELEIKSLDFMSLVPDGEGRHENSSVCDSSTASNASTLINCMHEPNFQICTEKRSNMVLLDCVCGKKILSPLYAMRYESAKLNAPCPCLQLALCEP